ncbi:OLC1v1009944C1 [Oldenlandia corymbosa var. corymbosa]|uniref:OLC1v1009944C1 n=1 Tax=Oldenlandia corymbosa var. corymbosa TaxID=529605 RepID=A0AAV1DT38_OLDCO|nr:OLC1v1009944C1 [Oldenlandia corymbosa var. corymbosa]
MFTPQKKTWSWSLTPRRDQNRSGATASGSSPPNGESLGKEKDSLSEKISHLETELYDYQYNLGLLLIEKKEWTAQHEELKNSLAEITEAYKREQAAHLIAISEVEKREENLRTALGTEKLCVLDLEKALRDMRSEHAEIQFTADSKLNEAKSLVASVEQKSLEVEAKLRAADAKIAEVNKKTSEFERKSQELVAQENALRRERLSFTTECGMQEANLAKQREDLREWEQKLHESEERLAESRTLLNQREQRANENDNLWKQKQKELEDVRRKVDEANSSLKEKEEDMAKRQAALFLLEKEAEDMRKSLEMKEKQLIELEEKLNVREKVEMEKLLDEHKATLDGKEKEFELELEQKRSSADQELKTKAGEVEKKEAELNHMEEKIRKREQALEKKMEKLKDKESEFDLKSKALKEKEKSLKNEEKNMGNERKQIGSEKESLLSLKVELEKLKSDVENQQLKIREETELLKVTEEERSEHARLQLELKQEIDKSRIQNELLLKEGEDLRQERLRFEKEWEELDEKGAKIKKELADIAEEKKNIEKFKWSEEERLKKEKLETESYVKRELEALELARESFAANMKHDRTMLDEEIQSKKSQLLNELEIQKRELETEREKQREEMESQLREMEKSFEEKKEEELKNINYLRDVAHREMEEMKLQRHVIDKEKEEISANKEQLEKQHLEMRKDIDDLVGLSRKLKDQREQFIKERQRFIAFVENLKSCGNCMELIREFVLTDLQSLNEIDNDEAHLLPRVVDNHLKDAVPGTSKRVNANQSPIVGDIGSPGTVSWLRKCTAKILRFSPGGTTAPNATQGLNGGDLSGKLVTVESKKVPISNEIEPETLGFAEDSLDVEKIQSENSMRNLDGGPDPSVDDQRSHPSNTKRGKRKPVRRGRSRVTGGKFGQANVADKTANHVGSSSDNKGQYDNGNIQASEGMPMESGPPSNARKRKGVLQPTISGNNDEYSEHSASVTGEGPRRRKQKVTEPVQDFGENRYNFRRPRRGAAAAAAAATNGSLAKETEFSQRSHAEQISSTKNTPSNTLEVGGGAREETRDSNAAPAASEGANGDAGAVKSIQDHEFSADSPILSKDAALAQEAVSNSANLAEGDVGTSEEVIGTPECGKRESNLENSGEPMDDEEDDDDEDDEVEHPGEVSMGKKLWNFLTT